MTDRNHRMDIARVLGSEWNLPAETVDALFEVPADRKKGDLALPCFRLAKDLKQAPPQISTRAAAVITESFPDRFSRVEAVGPYLNIFFDPRAGAVSILGRLISESDRFGSSSVGGQRTIILDYSSPNIAKPFSVGHLRSTVIGHAVGNILEFQGYKCVRINHLGDWGTQFGKLMVAYQMWGDSVDLEGESPIRALLDLYVKFHNAAETDAGLEDQAREWFKKLEDGESEAVRLWTWFRDLSIKEFERMYSRLGVHFDAYSGESFYNDKMQPVIERLECTGLLQESRGAKIVDLEPYGLTPVLIQRSDDATLYATRDLAAAFYRKATYQFHKNLYFVATQQNEHFKQVFKVLELLGEDWAADCVHVPFGLISFEEGVMSSRKGKVIFLEDVLDQAVERVDTIIAEKNPELARRAEIAEQVGVGAIRFYDLSRRRIKDWTFNWGRILNFDGETGPYVMYTHARMCSILRKAAAKGISPFEQAADIDFSSIDSEEARELLQEIETYPESIERAAEQYEPSILAQKLVDIADRANRFYNAHHVLVEEENVARTRLLLVQAVVTLLRSGLNLLGLSAPEEM